VLKRGKEMDTVKVRVKDIKISLLHWDKTSLPVIVAKKLGIPANNIRDLKIVKRGVDARNKNEILLVFTFDVSLDKKLLDKVVNKPFVALVKDAEGLNEPLLAGSQSLSYQPVVIGTGPAGLFAALTLAVSGYKPLVFERGAKVEERTRDIMQFWHTGELKPDSNVQFGEGGAGTFSDGKLTSRIKDRRTQMVLTELVEAGAPEEILFQQKPHLGTDNLALIVQSLREKIISLGGQVYFHSQVTDIILEHNQITGIEINHQYNLPAQVVVLAIGHSARDTFEVLIKRGIKLEQKPFAVGVRIEHPQQLINVAQYGSFAQHPELAAADYQLVHKSEHTGKTAYTFCMCPGGQVVAAASEPGGVVTNGMSNYARDTELANSGLVVSVSTEDFPNDGPLAGVELQRQWEQSAFAMGGKNYRAPAQTVGDFLADRDNNQLDTGVAPSYLPGVTPVNLNDLLPKWACETMAEALRIFGKKLVGFDSAGAVLTGVETRTSSPVRIVRDDHCQAVNVTGLYPAGEGAGYAGGIMSAAVDGVKVAQAIITRYSPPKSRVEMNY
jgi:uncharacterized FAD-dependent dehydrogenase